MRSFLFLALLASCQGFVNPSAMASRAVVRAASVAPTPAVMQFRSKPVEKKGSRVLKRSVKKVVKKVGKKVAKKAAKPLPKGARPVQGGAKTGAGPLGTAKSFFSFGSDGGADSAASQDNWLYQAFNGLKSLPGSETGKYSSKSKDNTLR